jgi:transcriptional regulator with XRE-family HTH domain
MKKLMHHAPHVCIIDRMTFGRKLEHLMVEHGTNRFKLSKRMGLGNATVNRWVDGTSKPSMVDAFRLAREFGVSLDWLADDAQDYPPASIYSAPPRPAGSIRYPEPPPPPEPAAPPPKRGRKR